MGGWSRIEGNQELSCLIIKQKMSFVKMEALSRLENMSVGVPKLDVIVHDGNTSRYEGPT